MTTSTLERPPVAAEFNPIQDGQRLMKAWYAGLEQAKPRGQNVANVFVMGNAIEILRVFGFELVFPEINYDRVDKVRGMNITICTSAENDADGKALLEALGMPFRK